MSRVERKGRETDRDIFRPGRVRRAVAHPFAATDHDGLPGRDVDHAVAMLDPQPCPRARRCIRRTPALGRARSIPRGCASARCSPGNHPCSPGRRIHRSAWACCPPLRPGLAARSTSAWLVVVASSGMSVRQGFADANEADSPRPSSVLEPSLRVVLLHPDSNSLDRHNRSADIIDRSPTSSLRRRSDRPHSGRLEVLSPRVHRRTGASTRVDRSPAPLARCVVRS